MRTALLALCLLIVPGLPAAAQVLELNGHSLSLSKTEMARLGELRRVLYSLSRGVQDRALAAAKSGVTGPDGRYVLALYQLEISMHRNDDALGAEALDVLIPSRDTPADKRPGYLSLRGAIAFRARDYATAAANWNRVAEIRPGDAQMLNNLAQLRDAQGDPPGAVDLLSRAIAAYPGRPDVAPESWYRQRLSLAFNARLVERGTEAAHALVAAYPTDSNWRLALVAFRQLVPPAGDAEIDLMRLMRVAGALTQPAEYQRFAQLLRVAGIPAEGKAVIEEGLAHGLLSRGQSPTPEILAELDRDIARGSPAPPVSHLADPAALNMRRGLALALEGRRAEAETAFRALARAAQGSPASRWYGDLARFALVWLALRR